MLKTPSALLDLDKRPAINQSLTLPAPYCDLQRELIESDAKLAVFCTGTKVGKSLGSSIRLSRLSFTARTEQDALFRIISPTYKQARIIYKYINRLMPKDLPQYVADTLPPHLHAQAIESWQRFTPERSDTGMWAKWPHNRATIECAHGSDPEATIEGERVHGQIIDEASKCKEQVFVSAMTTTTQTGGSTFLVSTPRGKGWFYKVAMECKEHEEWARRKGVKPTRIFRTLPTMASPYVSAEVIENARRSLPARLFRQLYEASFEDDGSVFTELSFAFGNVVEFIYEDQFMPEYHESEMIFVGVDWAKTHDYTVMIAMNEKGHMIAWKRIQKSSYPQQVSIMFNFCDVLKERAQKGGVHNPSAEIVIKHDQTGVGEAVNDIMSLGNLKGYAIEGMKWNNALKEVAVNDLILSLEEHSIKLLPWATLNTEIQAFELETSASGNPIYGAPEGQHDDTVMSLVLANSLFRNNAKRSSGIILIDTMARQVEYMYYNFDSLEDID
jgi:hypothetical protein